ncbi:phosphoadenylyl-sulfate reductase [Tabrizicola oligotrophica]|uniref:Adenosine 5'-phosphosulfate reductase n=1 Tax=Tabrizicola oligotrophica TaxID=2710650 RepID=A0A6M0QQR8_9RHOB|nr:phosphoadenylyl-sulfate reductase [Tabrizicola oligotrophica]NEY88722.1 phosphoadenylyl-sulfate reductase [Tabrizicola oligotrophica]
MLLKVEQGTIAERVAALNARYRHHSATAVLEHALKDPDLGQVALVSSFGAESVVLLHLVSVIAPETPVIFVDTRMLFQETLDYQRELAEKLPLCDIRTIRARKTRTDFEDPDGTLHQFSTDACCNVRKVEPLERALQGFDGWITGRKRFQNSDRGAIDFFENEGDFRIKVNPLAHWGREDLEEYLVNNNLPRHPLVAKGYPSIGCAPCTSPVKPGEDPRAGRWRGQDKSECGIHFINGKPVRTTKDNAL